MYSIWLKQLNDEDYTIGIAKDDVEFSPDSDDPIYKAQAARYLYWAGVFGKYPTYKYYFTANPDDPHGVEIKEIFDLKTGKWVE